LSRVSGRMASLDNGWVTSKEKFIEVRKDKAPTWWGQKDWAWQQHGLGISVWFLRQVLWAPGNSFLIGWSWFCLLQGPDPFFLPLSEVVGLYILTTLIPSVTWAYILVTHFGGGPYIADWIMMALLDSITGMWCEGGGSMSITGEYPHTVSALFPSDVNCFFPALALTT
jgi:hypothetical protein